VGSGLAMDGTEEGWGVTGGDLQGRYDCKWEGALIYLRFQQMAALLIYLHRTGGPSREKDCGRQRCGEPWGPGRPRQGASFFCQIWNLVRAVRGQESCPMPSSLMGKLRPREPAPGWYWLQPTVLPLHPCV
jgi:hypothetical protein